MKNFIQPIKILASRHVMSNRRQLLTSVITYVHIEMFRMECKLHNTGQGSAEVSRSASFSKLRESLRRSSVRLFHRIAGRHSANLPPDVDFTDLESSMKRASSLSELSKASAVNAPAPVAAPR